MSRGSNTPVSSANMQNTTRTRKRSRSYPPVPRIRERVVQSPDQLGGFDVRRVLIPEGPSLHAEDEPERLDMRGQVREREGDDFALVEIVKLEGLEVAHQDGARAVALGQRVEILPGLFVGRFQVAPGALLLDDENARPEQVNEPGAIVELGDVLLVAGNLTTAFPKDLKELVVEALRLALLVRGVLPVFGKDGGAVAHLVPRQAHQAAPPALRRVPDSLPQSGSG